MGEVGAGEVEGQSGQGPRWGEEAQMSPCQAVMRRHGSQQGWTHPGGPAPPTPSRPGLGQLPEPQTALLSNPQLPLAWGGVQAPAGRDLTVALPLCSRVTEVSPRSPPGHTCRVGGETWPRMPRDPSSCQPDSSILLSWAWKSTAASSFSLCPGCWGAQDKGNGSSAKTLPP